MPETFPALLESPSSSDAQSLSKFTSYSYADENADATLDVTSFSEEGFQDFHLDLGCLSRSPSPPPSPPPQSDLPFSSYLPSSPPSSSRRSVSFSTGPTLGLERAASAPRLSTSPRISLTSVPNGPGSASWPLSRVGHGTPIDRGRRSAWAGNHADGEDGAEDVAEDGVLFSTIRSTSVDSTPRVSQRSISPLTEWNCVSPAPLVYKPYTDRHRSTLSLLPLPDSVRIQLPGINHNSSAEWASSTTQKVLSSPISAAASTSTPELSSETHFESAVQSVEELRTPDDRTNIEQQEGEIDLGLESLNAAVDRGLGLIPGGMTWFDVGILPGSGRASPSVYSCDQVSTPRLSRPHSVDPSETRTETRFPMRERLTSHLWWQRFLGRLQHFRDMLRRRRTAA
ncbi:hypothetical protein C8R45DRAFT_250200 [Mycena sanguinolenta]|nr:hypothetical protein C8R45DRAFT_250200 [Mycena sanguinolenta]